MIEAIIVRADEAVLRSRMESMESIEIEQLAIEADGALEQLEKREDANAVCCKFQWVVDTAREILASRHV